MGLSKTDRLQNIGTVLALAISIIAMLISIFEVSLMKSQQKAMVWPYLKVSNQYDHKGFGIQITNKGTGPAIVTSVQVDYNGSTMESIDMLMDSLNPLRTFGYNILRNNSIGDYVFTSGEKIILFGLPRNEETMIIEEKIDDIRLRIGYKSVLDEHWTYDTKDNSHIKENFRATIEFKN